jgi:potassium-transporting ATPase KdpC subunit
MLHHLRPAFVIMGLFTLLLGMAYPFAITGAAQLLFPVAANGSLLMRDGVVVGSSLIGQNVTSDRYFQPRPSATLAPDPADASKTVDMPYNAANSSGSNLGPLSQKLIDRVKADLAGKTGNTKVPADAVTTSASGLDPHISPANAFSQVAAIVRARQMPEDKLSILVTKHIEGRIFGLIGEARVNVLRLNMALDQSNQR